MFEIIDKLLLVAAEGLLLWTSNDLACTHALVLDSGQATCEHSLTDQRNCTMALSRLNRDLREIVRHTSGAGVESSNGCPLASTFLSGLVQDLGDEGNTVIIVEL